VRFLLATLIALALTALPLSGMQAAAAPAPAVHEMAHEMATGDCHQAPDPLHHDGKENGRACAAHCMTQANAPLASAPVAHPAIANAIAAEHAQLIDGRAPRAADPPDTPPPRA
jgi:hypothetical protein